MSEPAGAHEHFRPDGFVRPKSCPQAGAEGLAHDGPVRIPCAIRAFSVRSVATLASRVVHPHECGKEDLLTTNRIFSADCDHFRSIRLPGGAMGASTQQPPAHGPQGGLVRASRDSNPARPVIKGLLLGSLLLTTLAACNSSKGTGIRPIATTSTPTVTASATPSVQDQVLSQYRAFWTQLTPVSRMPAANRRAALAAYVIDPELKSLIAGFVKLDGKGQVLYGANKPRPVASVSSDGATAVVNDCQDSSSAGAANRATSQPVTKGVPRNHVVVTMKKSSDVWKVYFVSYSKTPC